MTLAENFDVYKNEIELIQAQNPVECELYSIISYIIRGRKNSTDISLRDVSTRRETKLSKIFKSESGFPDFVILTKQFKMDEPDKCEILGAIEVKNVMQKNLEYSEQLDDHIKYFKKVIYTNGLEWKFYKYDEVKKDEKLEWVVQLGKWNEEKISWNSDNEWNVLLDNLEKIKWIE